MTEWQKDWLAGILTMLAMLALALFVQVMRGLVESFRGY